MGIFCNKREIGQKMAAAKFLDSNNWSCAPFPAISSLFQLLFRLPPLIAFSADKWLKWLWHKQSRVAIQRLTFAFLSFLANPKFTLSRVFREAINQDLQQSGCPESSQGVVLSKILVCLNQIFIWDLPWQLFWSNVLRKSLYSCKFSSAHVCIPQFAPTEIMKNWCFFSCSGQVNRLSVSHSVSVVSHF